MVCDKAVCERWYVTKWCVKDCVKDGVRQSGLWKIVWKMVCQGWCVKDLPRHHSSSPCKPFCSEPQRTLLAVELQILILFNMLASIYVLPGVPSCDFLIFPTVSLISLVFPGGFSKLAIYLFLQLKGFFHNFPLFFKDFPSFSLVFSYLFPTVFKGPESNPTVTKLPSDTFPQKKKHLDGLITTKFRAPGPPPYTHFVLENNFA